MTIEIKTKRRWIASLLNAVAEPLPTRQFGRSEDKSQRQRSSEMQGFAVRLKAATRPVARAAR